MDQPPKTRELLFGQDRLPLRRLALQAGPLSMTLLPELGFLRYVRMGPVELIRGIYCVVRDPHWRTLWPDVSDVRVESHADRFTVSFSARSRGAGIDFSWRAQIDGQADGTVFYAVNGMANTTFPTNRTGICVLLPASLAGRDCTVDQDDGRFQRGSFPLTIAPNEPFTEIRAINFPASPGVEAHVLLAGDVFEMEDQRNWSDASFKVYSRPQSLPKPYELSAGQEVRQRVTLDLSGDVPAATSAVHAHVDAPIALTVEPKSAHRLAGIGLGCTPGQPLRQEEVRRLQKLHLSHLRVDVALWAHDCADRLRQAAHEASAVGTALEVAAFVSENAQSELRALGGELGRLDVPVRHVWVFHRDEPSTQDRWVVLARRMLDRACPGVPIGAGAPEAFVNLNRGRPHLASLDGVCWGICPQVHTPDDLSLMESLPTQAVQVDSARRFAQKLPLHIGPVTLYRPPARPAAAEALAASADPRQASLLGAAWTLGSLKHLAEQAVASITGPQTVGLLGVMEPQATEPAPEGLPVWEGVVFPLYHVLADVGEFAGGVVTPARSSRPLDVEVLALQRAGRTRVMVANLTDQPRRVRLDTFTGPVRVRRLNAATAWEAMDDPDAFRARRGEPVQAQPEGMEMPLEPYEVARIDHEG